MGWFDIPATKYGLRIQGATEVVLSLLDVLGYLDEIPMCTDYKINGKETSEFPVPALLENASPVLKTLKFHTKKNRKWRSSVICMYGITTS